MPVMLMLLGTSDRTHHSTRILLGGRLGSLLDEDRAVAAHRYQRALWPNFLCQGEYRQAPGERACERGTPLRGADPIQGHTSGVAHAEQVVECSIPLAHR